jgi:hypothetical protein
MQFFEDRICGGDLLPAAGVPHDALRHDSIATRHPGSNSRHQSKNRCGENALAATTRPAQSTACTWYCRFDRSTPTRAISARVISDLGFSSRSD